MTAQIYQELKAALQKQIEKNGFTGQKVSIRCQGISSEDAIKPRVQETIEIIFGLCVGHDSLVMRFSDALCTVLVAKDRVTGHNPLAAIQLHHSYYQKLKTEKLIGGQKTAH